MILFDEYERLLVEFDTRGIVFGIRYCVGRATKTCFVRESQLRERSVRMKSVVSIDNLRTFAVYGEPCTSEETGQKSRTIVLPLPVHSDG